MTKKRISKHEGYMKIVIAGFVNDAKDALEEKRHTKKDSAEYYMKVGELLRFYSIFNALKMHAEALGLDQKDLGLDKINHNELIG